MRTSATALVLLVCACGTNQGDVELQPNVTVLSDALAATMVVEPDRLLVPADGNEWVAEVPVGQILVAGYGTGFLRRVDAVVREVDRIVLDTTQAGLPDAIKSGRLQATEDFARELGTETESALRQELVMGDLIDGVTLDDIVLYEHEQGRLILKHGFIRMTPSAALDVSIVDGELQYADVALSGDAEMQLTLGVESSERLTATVEKELYAGSRYHLYWIGAVPVLVEWALSLTLFGEIALECGISVEASAEASGRVDTGARYENGEVMTRTTHSLSGSASWPTLTRPAPISAKVSLRPRVDAKLWTIAGPFLVTGLYVRGLLAQPYQRTLYGGVEASFGGQLKILNPLNQEETLVDKTIQSEFVTEEWLLLNETENGMPLSCAMDAGMNDLGGEAADMTPAPDFAYEDLTPPSDMTSADMAAADMASVDMARPDLAWTDLAAPDMAGHCVGVLLPQKPEVAHETFDNESYPAPLPSCGNALDLPRGTVRSLDVGGDMFTGPFTFAMWFKSGWDGSGGFWFASNVQAGAPGFTLLVGGGSVSLQNGHWHTGGGAIIHDTSLFLAPLWHHLAITSNGSTMTMYIDGALVAFRGLPTNQAIPFSTGNPLVLGAYAGMQADFGGQVDDLRIYNRQLNSIEIRQLACSCANATDMGSFDLTVPEDFATPEDLATPDMSMPEDMAMPDDLTSVSCVQDAGPFTPPNICDNGVAPPGFATYVVCRANCESAWISTGANTGMVDALATCEMLGYKSLGSFGTTGGTECGAFESGPSCSNVGQRTFNGMGSSGGNILSGGVHWECLPN